MQDHTKIIDELVARKKLPTRLLSDSAVEGISKLIDRVLRNVDSRRFVDELFAIGQASRPGDQVRLLLDPSPLSAKQASYVVERYGFRVRENQQLSGNSRLILAELRQEAPTSPSLYSAIIPCRNEGDALRRVPEIFTKTNQAWELVFVEGNSTDNTLDVIKEIERQSYDRIKVQAFQQVTKGKAGAVFEGFDRATGDYVFIFDGDATVRTEDLLGMGRYLEQGRADVCNGNRLFFDRDKGSMKLLNRFGNTFFALCHYWVTKNYHADVFCGTKAFKRELWPAIKAAKPPFEGHDRYGDFQLLFAAHDLRLKVDSFPVHYLARVAGTSTLNPFVEGKNFVKSTLQAKRFQKNRATGQQCNS